jgi:hypothetical protein
LALQEDDAITYTSAVIGRQSIADRDAAIARLTSRAGKMFAPSPPRTDPMTNSSKPREPDVPDVPGDDSDDSPSDDSL